VSAAQQRKCSSGHDVVVAVETFEPARCVEWAADGGDLAAPEAEEVRDGAEDSLTVGRPNASRAAWVDSPRPALYPLRLSSVRRCECLVGARGVRLTRPLLELIRSMQQPPTRYVRNMLTNQVAVDGECGPLARYQLFVSVARCG